MYALEPLGGNMYKPHPMQIHSGLFWRCKHGVTGFKEGLEWVGCEGCKEDDPEAYERWQQT